MGPVLKVSALQKQVDVLQSPIHSGNFGETSTMTQGDPGSLNPHYIKKQIIAHMVDFRGSQKILCPVSKYFPSLKSLVPKFWNFHYEGPYISCLVFMNYFMRSPFTSVIPSACDALSLPKYL